MPRLNLNEQVPITRHCSKCGCRIPISSAYDQCKECMKNELFPKVKEFILNNYDVNEVMVAEEFGIDTMADRSKLHHDERIVSVLAHDSSRQP